MNRIAINASSAKGSSSSNSVSGTTLASATKAGIALGRQGTSESKAASVTQDRANGPVTNGSVAPSSTSKGTSQTKRPRAPVLRTLFAGVTRATPPVRAQFVRVEIYAVQGVSSRSKSGTQRKPKASAGQILDEATRATPEGYKHLTAQGIAPKPPVCLHGLDAPALIDWYQGHKARAARNRAPYTRDGRAYSKSQPVTWPTLLSEVASYPGPSDDGDAGYLRWKELCVARLKEVYGNRLVSVLEHRDEPHGHLHAIVAHSDASPVRDLHPGEHASRQCLAAGGSHKEAAIAYKSALMRFQELFHELVGRPSGLVRLAKNSFARYSYAEAQVRRQMEKEIHVAEATIKGEEFNLRLQREGFEADFARRVADADARVENATAAAFRRAAAAAEERVAAQAERERQRLAERALDLERQRRDLEEREAALAARTTDINARLDGLNAEVRARMAQAQAKEDLARARENQLFELLEGQVEPDTLGDIRRSLRRGARPKPST
jgi:hypothetical protein